ncbi:MAG: hypothetical protein IJT88_02445 [Kiritimatiellae bacterium]|nr:hypothetical protein [Kiritimatiellia bacterium]
MERIWKRRRWEDTPCAACALSEDGRAAGHGRGLSLEHVPPRELLEHGAEEWPRREPFEWLAAEDAAEAADKAAREARKAKTEQQQPAAEAPHNV